MPIPIGTVPRIGTILRQNPRMRVIPMSMSLSRPSIPEHPRRYKRREKHHYTHSVLWFPYPAMFFSEIVYESVICGSYYYQADEETYSGAQIG